MLEDWCPVLPPRVGRDKGHPGAGLVPLAVGILGFAPQSQPELRWLLSLCNHWLLCLGDGVGHHFAHLTLIPTAALPSKHSCFITSPRRGKGDGDFSPGVTAPTSVPGGTHLSIPEIAAAGGLEHEDVVGIEGGSANRHLDGLGVVLVGAVHVEEAGGGCGLLTTCP